MCGQFGVKNLVKILTSIFCFKILTFFWSCMGPLRRRQVKGIDPFSGRNFYLWTDLNEICTAYVKLNSKIFLFLIFFFRFRYGFRENLKFSRFYLCLFFQKNRSQKLSVLKKRQFCNLQRILHMNIQSDFWFLNLTKYIYFFQCFQEYAFFDLQLKKIRAEN